MNEVTSTRFTTASELLEWAKKTNNFCVSAPIDVDRLAETLGVDVVYDMSLETKDVIGQIQFRDDRPLVTINPIQNSYGPRRRFTLAHELGHLCLHASESKKMFVDSQQTMSRTASYWRPEESEANNFAAQLLMPFDLLIEEGRQSISAYQAKFGSVAMPTQEFIEDMADRFVVSSKSMEYRLKNIGILKK